MNNELVQLLKNHDLADFSFISFQHLSTFNVKSLERLPNNPSSVIAIIFPYYTPKTQNGNISAYAACPDYHKVVGMQLKSICEELKSLYPDDEFVPFVDSSPIDEVDMCAKAGLGVVGKHSLLIHKTYGSFLFIGEIVTTLDLDNTICEVKSCINCGLCEKECYGGAIGENGVDVSKCASNINQKKGELTAEEISIIQKCGLVWGCDKCQQVCPLNKDIPISDNLLTTDTLDTVYADTIQSIYKSRAFGFKGLKILLRNFDILDK